MIDKARALQIAGIALGLAALLGLFLIFTGEEDEVVTLPPERDAAPTAASQNPDRTILAEADDDDPAIVAAEPSEELPVETPEPLELPRRDEAPSDQNAPIRLQPDEVDVPAPVVADAGGRAVTFCFPEVIPTPTDCADRETVLAFATEEIGVRAADGVTEALAVELVDPAGLDDPRTARTCEQYLSLKANDWGPMTTAAMRRDAKMNRFCGLIAMARRAQPGQGGLTALTEDLLEGMPDERWPTIGEAAVENPLVLDTPGDPRAWFVQADRVEFTMRDVASADFDGDGANEVLVFTALQAADGTAVGGGYSLAEMRDGTLTLKAADLY